MKCDRGHGDEYHHHLQTQLPPNYHSSLSVLPINMNLVICHRRRLLQEEDADRALGSPAPSFTTNSPFDSSLALTILVLLTVLFFMAFFSLYIRRFSSTNNSDDSDHSGHRQSPGRYRTGKHAGLDASAVRSLPIVLYGGDSKIWSECSICLSEFEERETVKVIPYCRHGFHPMCIDRWLSSHVSCPVCRSTQLFPAVDEVAGGNSGGRSDGGDGR